MKALELMEAARPVPLSPVSDRESDEQELAQEVNKLLGYGGYTKHLEGNKLGRVLNELGIGVLPTAAVTKYKDMMIKKVQNDPFEAQAFWFQANSIGLNSWGNLGNFISSEEAIRASQQRTVQMAPMPMPTRYEAGWGITALQSFQGTVPKRALADAVRIKKALPTVTFQVHSLEVRAVYDPFLEVSLGDQSYFIHVWDEDSFDA